MRWSKKVSINISQSLLPRGLRHNRTRQVMRPETRKQTFAYKQAPPSSPIRFDHNRAEEESARHSAREDSDARHHGVAVAMHCGTQSEHRIFPVQTDVSDRIADIDPHHDTDWENNGLNHGGILESHSDLNEFRVKQASSPELGGRAKAPVPPLPKTPEQTWTVPSDCLKGSWGCVRETPARFIQAACSVRCGCGKQFRV
jgi:hypothetical protein